LFYAPLLLRLMGASPEIVAVGGNYARIALGGCGAVLMLFLNNDSTCRSLRRIRVTGFITLLTRS